MSRWTDHRTAPRTCPHCGSPNDTLGNPYGDEGPDQGDVCICIRCGSIAILGADLAHEKPTDSQLVELMLSDSWPQIVMAQAAVKRARDRRNR